MRWRGKIPFNPSITQDLTEALHDAGRDDLVDALRRSGLHQLEEEIDLVKKRIVALEQERVKFVHESGVHRILRESVVDEAIDWGKWAVRGTLGAATLAGASWLLSMAWKGFHGG